MSDCGCSTGYEVPLRGLKFDLDKSAIRQIVQEIIGSGNGGGSGEGLPIFSLIWSLSGQESGFIDISQDKGLLSRADFPDAWAKIEQMIAAGNPIVVDDANWLGEKEANNGVCCKFSRGDGVTTFRVPVIAEMEIAAASVRHAAGSYQPDQMRPITGGAWATNYSNYITPSGAIYYRNAVVNGASSSGANRADVYLDSARLGVHYSGEDTHSKRIFAVPLLKM